MKHNNIRLAVYALMSLVCMSLIFFLSAQEADASQSLSDGILGQILLFLGVEDPRNMELLGKLIRKLAHFCEFALLGLSLSLFFSELAALYAAKLRVYRVSFVFSALYACTDELHQLFVPGRSAQLSDVLLDSVGAAAGILTLYFIRLLFIHREDHKHYE